MTLSVQSLDLVRGTRLLQSGLSFGLKLGEALWVRGPNGVGKSTLLETICGFRPPGGAVCWQGVAIEKNRDDFLDTLAFAGHKNANASALTVDVALSFYADLFDSTRKDMVLDRFGLAHRRNIPVSYLSAGQQRRLALARLLLRKSQIWVLDEPATSLDQEGAALVADLIAEQTTTGGMVIYTSHIDLGIDAREYVLKPIARTTQIVADEFLGEGWAGAQ